MKIQIQQIMMVFVTEWLLQQMRPVRCLLLTTNRPGIGEFEFHGTEE